MPRKKKSIESEKTISDSVGSLADEFLKRYRDADPDAFSLDDRTHLSPETHSGRNFHPTWAAVLSLYLWGSGFLYLERTLLASISLILFLGLDTLYLAVTGILPQWLAVPLLRDLHWNLPTELSLIALGGAIGFFWWTSIVGATFLALRSLGKPFRAKPHIWLQVFLYPFPAIGQYLRGRFWKGHLDALFLIMALLSSLAVRALWIAPISEPMNPFKEMIFAFFLGVSLIGILGLLLGYWVRAISILRDLEWLGDSSQGVYSEPKFVLLGSALLLFLLAKVFLGSPGALAREKGSAFCTELETRGYRQTATEIRTSLRSWQSVADLANDSISLTR